MSDSSALKALNAYAFRPSLPVPLLLCAALALGPAPRAEATPQGGAAQRASALRAGTPRVPASRVLDKRYKEQQHAFATGRSAVASTAPRGRTTLYVHTPNLNAWVMNKAAGPTVPYYDERALPAAVAALADPAAHSIIVVTRQPSERELDALFRSLSEAARPSARERLSVICAPRAPGKSLLHALRKDPTALASLTAAVATARERGDDLRLSAYSVDRDLARLGGLLELPIWGATPQQRRHGTKAASRRWFDQAEVAHLEGSFGPLRDTQAIVAALSAYVDAHPRRTLVVLKHNDGAAGQGIAFLGLAGLSRLQGPARTTEIEKRLGDPRQLTFAVDRRKAADDATRDTWASFEAEVRKVGVVVEEYVPRPLELSVQLVLHPEGRVEVESCHRQLTRDGHYLGCEQPVEPALAKKLAAIGDAVGSKLARAGVVGPIGIDVLGQRSRRPDGSSELLLKACEVNLRTPATRYAAELAKGATGARFDEGLLRTAQRGVVVYRQTDNLDRTALGPAVEGLTPDALLPLLDRHGLLYDAARGRGIVPALLGALTVEDRPQRKLGGAFVATSPSARPEDLRAAQRQVRELQRMLRRVLSEPG
ncbi:MAG: hypothetical protein IPG96_07245 [Proteobacteria bacterium]|nr:hypothetical protein [Pseudomonadota bacterium]